MENWEFTNCYLIIGGVGFGKTTLVEHICTTYGFYFVPEAARDLLMKRKESSKTPLVWSNIEEYLHFEQELLNRRIQILKSMPTSELCFADTGIPNSQVFFSKTGLQIPSFIKIASERYRYNRKAFFTPPWRKIYKQDLVRPQTYEEAEEIGELVLEIYQNLGYEIIELPHADIDVRSQFILEHI